MGKGYHKNERISLSPTQYCALLVNLFVTLQQSDSSVVGKMVNYKAEICTKFDLSFDLHGIRELQISC